MKFLEENLPRPEFNALMRWAEVISRITHSEPETSVLRGLVTRAHYTNKKVSEVLTELAFAQSITKLIPPDLQEIVDDHYRGLMALKAPFN
ncbi:hypothetical protein C4553_02700 [Candidatus Parcubacteria bacterium]|nr:MAG: hypothetical protein C4553_02700 [Candidatus Parcubacteria bacterium]